MTLTKEAIKKLRRVKRFILEEPKRLRMSDWVTVLPDGTPKQRLRALQVPDCGTVACIAGWVVLLDNKREYWKLMRKEATESKRAIGELTSDQSYVEDKARRILGLNDYQVHRLFFVGQWAHPFQAAYTEAETKREEARIAAARIEHFIKTGGE